MKCSPSSGDRRARSAFIVAAPAERAHALSLLNGAATTVGAGTTGAAGNRPRQERNIDQAREPGLFCIARNSMRYVFEDEEPAMKDWIGALALTALCVVGGKAAVDPAAAANAAPQTIQSGQTTEVSSQRRHHRAQRHRYRHYRPSYHARPYYLGRPTYYAPAPFPLGFGFGFFW
jgi:hypothetical protein